MAGEPVDRADRSVTCGMYAVGESASGGVEGPEETGRLGVPETAGRVDIGIPPGVAGRVGAAPGGRVGVAPGGLPVPGGRVGAALGAVGRVDA
ncbi:hypothetical protein F8280_24840, partial [Micromonospora noduli]